MRDMPETRVTDGNEPYELKEPDKSIGDLAGRLTSELGALFNDHLQLAKVEIVEDLKKAGRGAGLMGGAAVAGWIAALVLSFALAWGLAELMDTWIAFVIVGALWAIGAALMASMGKKALDEVDPVPTETVHELERDKEWISEQRN